MGYWNIQCIKCGTYLWDENPDLEAAMDEEWIRGYESGLEDKVRLAVLRSENEKLRELLAANVRVIKKELRKELSEEIKVKEQVRDTDL